MHWADVSGETYEYEVKCRMVLGDSGCQAAQVWWDFPGIHHQLCKTLETKPAANKWWRNRRDDVALCLEGAGFSMEDSIRRPRHAAETSRPTGAPLPAGAHAWSTLHLSTECLLLALRHFALRSRYHHDQKVCKRFLIAWVLRFVPAETCATHVFTSPPGLQAAVCVQRAGDSSMCSHIAKIFAHMRGGGNHDTSPPQVRVARGWLEAGSLAPECGISAEWSKVVLGIFVEAVKGTIPDVSYTKNPLEATLAQPGSMGKRRRVDADFRMAVVHQVVHSGQSRSSRIYLKNRALDADLSKRWDEQFLCKYLSATWGAFAPASTISLALDGSRLGQPAEGTEVIAAFTPASGHAAWIAPQAARGSHQCTRLRCARSILFGTPNMNREVPSTSPEVRNTNPEVRSTNLNLRRGALSRYILQFRGRHLRFAQI